ncbi:hypothetical protein A6A04_02545 [Paramagnetospirillum marisnigri]|uniref:Uncharacterized protein n=1 Tax=Paramagnetospirillum marisnigri TaxID=1285242 RepID=A0A178MQI0_9PROT|nr:hypothetical protein [Paramagnetospirillum marisnigri]OAN50297.1 hypothetical protein A6A04_02545 [Paramagnetospirillum marisnigri]
MSVSAASSSPEPFGWEGSLVPRLATENAATAPGANDPERLHMFAEGDDEPSFWDFLDVINPLQHIPLVNDLYREATGDKIGVGARLAGGALFGGPIGLIGSALNAVLEEATGHDAGGHLIALFKDDSPTKDAPTTAIAAAPTDAKTKPEAPQQLAQATETTKPGVTAKTVTPEAAPEALAAAAKPLLLPDMPVDTSKAAAATPAALAAQQPPVPQAAPVAPVTKTAANDGAIRAVDSAEGKPMPLLAGRQPRLMPVPGRTTPMATQSPPAVGTSISNSGMRSNTPVTGARPNRPVITPAMAQEMAANQSAANAAGAASGDWFSSAMMQGLSKYERNSKLGAGSTGSVTEAQ